MKTSRQILIFSFILVGFGVLAPALSALLGLVPPDNVFLFQLLFYLSRLLTAIPPFFMLGVAVGSLRVRGMGYAIALAGIYAGLDLFLQVPLTLLTYDSVASSAPFWLILLSELLSSLLSSAIFLLFLILGYAVFIQGRQEDKKAPLLSLGDGSARVLGLCALAFTLYHLIYEIIDMVSYAKDKLYILSSEDVLDMGISLFFFLFLGFFVFYAARLSERLLPTMPTAEDEEESF